MTETFDTRLCELGEGPLWHPGRRQLFWFDIPAGRLLSRRGDEELSWSFDRPVSAAGWIDDDTLLVAGAGALMRFDIATGRYATIAALEDDRPGNRSNDGRADPWGGFWIGTMGRGAEYRAGAIWRFWKGELRRLHEAVTIPNAISFTPDGGFVHFADTRERKVWRQRLGPDGWPMGDRGLFLDLAAEGLNPDGAVCDAEGGFWLACWGAGRVLRYGADGRRDRAVELPVSQPSCPAFGGPDLATLFVTSARENLSARTLAGEPLAGAVFRVETGLRGQAEHRVVL